MANNRHIALTGGIACGKSLVASMLRERGIETLDADDIVHGLIPAEERRRLAAKVFADPAARKELEARIHPLVKSRLTAWLDAPAASGTVRVAVIPLLFEAGWEKDFDTVICVSSPRELQIGRMIETRGYSREEAESRIAAQMDVVEKARRSDLVIENAGSRDSLAERVAEIADKIKGGVAKTDDGGEGDKVLSAVPRL